VRSAECGVGGPSSPTAALRFGRVGGPGDRAAQNVAAGEGAAPEPVAAALRRSKRSTARASTALGMRPPTTFQPRKGELVSTLCIVCRCPVHGRERARAGLPLCADGSAVDVCHAFAAIGRATRRHLLCPALRL